MYLIFSSTFKGPCSHFIFNFGHSASVATYPVIPFTNPSIETVDLLCLIVDKLIGIMYAARENKMEYCITKELVQNVHSKSKNKNMSVLASEWVRDTCSNVTLVALVKDLSNSVQFSSFCSKPHKAWQNSILLTVEISSKISHNLRIVGIPTIVLINSKLPS